MLFIPNWVWEFLEELRHLEKHPHTAVSFYAQRPRFLAFRRYFESTVAEFNRAKQTGVPAFLGGAG